MKILQLIKTEVGAKWALRQVRELRKIGFEVIVTLPSIKGLANEYTELGVKVIEADINFPIKKLWKLPKVITMIRNIVNEEKPDLIHSHFVGTTYTTRVALGRNHPIPRVFQVPGPMHLENGPYGYIDKFLSGSNDYWIGSCQWTCNKYLEIGVPANRIYHSIYGLDTDIFKVERTNILRDELNIDHNTRLIGMVAYMYPPKKYLGQTVGIKGHEDFINAFSIVKKNISNIKGVIIGGAWGKDKQYEEKIRNMAEKVCGKDIIFTGFRYDIADIYPDLDIAVHPSHTENIGGAGESLLAQVPTITTNVGGFPDVILEGETGWMVPPKDPTRLAETIIEVLGNRIEADRRARNGRNLALEMLEVKNTVQGLAEIYRRLIDSKKNRGNKK